jgi:hypothetical protein
MYLGCGQIDAYETVAGINKRSELEEKMKFLARFLSGLAITALLAMPLPGQHSHRSHSSSQSSSRPYYGGGHHTESHGGHYTGSHGAKNEQSIREAQALERVHTGPRRGYFRT